MAGTNDKYTQEATSFGHIQLDEKPGTIHDEDGQQKRATDPVLKSSLDDLGILKTVRRFWKAVLVCNLMCIAAGADGYQIVLNGNIIANQGFINHMGFQNEAGVYQLNAQYTALWGAMQSLGQLTGMVLLNPISDLIGRKMTMYTLWIILAGSLIIETLADDWRHWAGAKLLAGIGVGCLQATLPIYVTEWAPVNIRGAMVLLYGFWNRIGSFLAPMVLTISARSDPTNYLTPILTQWGFLGIMLPIFLWIPETAAYYAERDQDDRGKASLRRINGNVEGYDIDNEYAVIKNTILEERQAMEAIGNKRGFRNVMRSYAECFKGSNAKRTLGAALPVCSQQLTGLSFLNTYASLFFRQSGFTDPFLITTILTVIALVVSITLISLTDLFGRRKVVVISAIVCTTAMLVVGILGFVEKTEPLKNFLIFVACVWSFFNVALGSLGWAFVGEVASQKLRARTAGLAAGSSVLFGLTFNTSLPIMLDVDGANWGYKTAWLFLGTGAVCCVGAFFYVPEPSKRNAAELDEMFEKRVPARQMRKYVTEVQMAGRSEAVAEKGV
ncbi:MFS general substrate transporter [Cadophora sp. DSE1049]|nr:MFS general substrate transporter [Cadophora sp. DSE1049]